MAIWAAQQYPSIWQAKRRVADAVPVGMTAELANIEVLTVPRLLTAPRN